MSLAAQLQYVGYSLLGLVLLGVVLIVVARIRRGPEEPAPEEVPHEGVGLDEATVQFIADLHRDIQPPADVMAPEPHGPQTLAEWFAERDRELAEEFDEVGVYLDGLLGRLFEITLPPDFAAEIEQEEREIERQRRIKAEAVAAATQEIRRIRHLVDCEIEETGEISMRAVDRIFEETSEILMGAGV